MARNYEIKTEPPDNINDLVKMAAIKISWSKRLEAVNELKKWDCQKSRDVLKRLALHDRVYKVMEEAFRAAQAMGITKNGKPIYLGKKDIGYKSGDFIKVFSRIKRECKLENLDIEIFRDKFDQVDPEMYDVMSYEKRDKLDNWIESIYNSLPKK